MRKPSTNDWLKPILIPMALAGLILSSLAWAMTQQIKVNGVQLNVQLDHAIEQQQDPARWEQWLRRSLQSVQSVASFKPQTELAIQLVSSNSDKPVSFGRVRRSSPPQVHFYLNPNASLAELLDDWHSYHEFAHLLIPFPGSRDIWFSEGLASYYQYLLQARAGVIESEEAWRRLMAGFERGQNDPNGIGQSLKELSPAMWDERAFRRVYWTGAAFFLSVDTRLRTESSGQYSLDTVLAEFNECCRNSQRRWTAQRLIEAFGKLSLPHIWNEEYAARINRPATPLFSQAVEQLGIKIDESGTRFTSQPDDLALRQAIALGNSSQPASE